ncbi:MAG: hypothetical protein ACRDYA_24235 [Egibacteraceae bacterium]
MTHRPAPLIVALLAILNACMPGKPQMNAEEALNEVKKLVNATLADVAPNAEVAPDSIPGGQPCESSLTGHTGQWIYDYGFSFPVPDEAAGERLVAEAAKFWKKQGHEVEGDLDDEYSPVIHTGKNGFNYQFIFARRTLSVSVGGSTPCVDPLPGDV